MPYKFGRLLPGSQIMIMAGNNNLFLLIRNYAVQHYLNDKDLRSKGGFFFR